MIATEANNLTVLANDALLAARAAGSVVLDVAGVALDFAVRRLRDERGGVKEKERSKEREGTMNSSLAVILRLQEAQPKCSGW